MSNLNHTYANQTQIDKAAEIENLKAKLEC